MKIRTLGYASFLLPLLTSSPVHAEPPAGRTGRGPGGEKPAASAVTTPLSEKQPYTLARTEERFITSTAGKEYRIMISWPEGRAPDSGFPITYVLDGDDIFPMATATLRVQAGTEKLSQHNAISPGLIVGIGYRGKSGRSVDYIPNVPKQGPPETYVDGRPYPEQPVGDAETFLDFLLKELRPAIEKDYAVDRTRQSLLGNGYGGLFALHVLFTRPESFQTYVASSPSVWWNNKYILQEEAEFAKRVQSQPVQATLVMSAGELEQTLTQHEYSWPDGPREEHASKTARRRMVDNTREMSWRLIKLESKGLKSSYRVFPGESHKSVIPVAVASALPLVFPSLPGSGPVDDKESGKEKAKTAEAGSSLPDTVKAK